jgi:molecular chaperone GrpE
MTDMTARAPEPASEAPEKIAAAGQPAQEGAAPDPVEVLTREVAELKDRLLRTLAEMENMRRRTDREVADARVYGIQSFARDVLAVADNMQRALDAVGGELRANIEPGVRSLLDGVELTERELLKVLERQGIRKFEPHGEKFDPNLHQAMYQVPHPSAPSGTVVQVVQPGYMIGERILRPAMVGVSAGGAKAASDTGGPDSQLAHGNNNVR